MKKITTTGDIPRHRVDDRAAPGGGFVMTGRPPAMSKEDFIAKYATEAEKDELVRAIVERRSKLPKWIYRVCPGCGWKSKTPYGDSDIVKSERPPYCFSCNRQGYKNGAIMRLMTRGEIMAFEKEAAEKEGKARERAFRAAFFCENQHRAELGLPALTEKEFRAHQKKQWAELTGEAWGGAK
jgi:hypothetical protein